MSKGTFKSIMSLMVFAAVLVLLLTRLDFIATAVGTVVAVLTPFVVGFILAYVVNTPYMLFYNKTFAFMDKKPADQRTKWEMFLSKMRKPLSLILAYAILLAVIAFLLEIIIPQITSSIQGVVDNFGSYYSSFQEWVFSVAAKFGFKYEFMSDVFADINSFISNYTGGEISGNMGDINGIIQKVADFLFPHIFDITKNIYNVVYNTIISFIVSIYYLANKEMLINQVKKITYSVVPQKYLGKVLRVTDLCNNMVGKFLYGKIIDSAIIGLLCFVTLAIFKIDYAVLLSVCVGLTNIIPFFGPIIGAIPGVILLLMISPKQALIFVIIIIVIQQLDGNFIGPKILGSSIGISGFWIMFSVLVGGGLFGFSGLLLGVPIFAVIYVLLGEKINDRLVRLGFATEENVRVDPLPKVAYEDGHIIADDEDDNDIIFDEEDDDEYSDEDVDEY